MAQSNHVENGDRDAKSHFAPRTEQQQPTTEKSLFTPPPPPPTFIVEYANETLRQLVSSKSSGSLGVTVEGMVGYHAQDQSVFGEFRDSGSCGSIELGC